MPWFPWPESIKKRACRYLLQHYLGQFLQEKLRLDQLSVDLYNGKGFVQNVLLDVYAINELLQQVHAPVEVLEGYVGSISVSIPWSALLSDSCVVEVRGIHVTAQPKYRADTDFSEMTDSLYNSLKNMTTSMELAHECFKNQEKQESEGQLFEGLELFAQTIESVLSRVKLSFVDTTMCLEHWGPSAAMGVGLQINIHNLEYFDEDSDKANTSTSQLKDGKTPMIQEITFACKQFRATGVNLSLYQFSESKSEEKSFTSGQMSTTEDIITSPILVAECFGEQQVKIRIKQNEQVSGPKVDAELYLGFCCVFLTPKQVHLLLELAEGFTSPASNECNQTIDSFPSSASPHTTAANKPLTLEDYRHIEGQLQSHEFVSATYSDYDDARQDTICLDPAGKTKNVQFHLMAESSSVDNMITADAFFEQPYHDEFKKAKEAMNFPADTDSQFSNHIDDLSEIDPALHSHKKAMFGDNTCSTDELFQCQMKLIAVSLTILHVDPIQFGHVKTDEVKSKTDQTKGRYHGDSPVDKVASGQSYQSELVTSYFHKIKRAFEKYSLTDLFNKRSVFTDAANKHDHLRILAGPVHVECERQCNARSSTSSEILINASVGNVELLECLYDAADSSRASECTEVELLLFPTFPENNMQQSFYASSFKEQSMKLKVKISDTNGAKSTSVHLHLAECKSEVDISIVDRVNALFYPVKMKPTVIPSASIFGGYSPLHAPQVNKQALFQQVLDDEFDNKSTTIEFNLTSSHLHVEFRFPIPDLRPEMERKPWFTRSLRDEVLHVIAKDLDCTTTIAIADEQGNATNQLKEVKVIFRDMSVLYSDEVEKPPKLFIRIYQGCSDDLGNQTDSENDLDWPFIQVNLMESKVNHHWLSSNDCIDRKAMINADAVPNHFSPHHKMEESSRFDDFPMLNSHYEQSNGRIPTPFSQRKVVYDSEEMILPGDEVEIQSFIDHASTTSGINIVLNFPVVQVNLPSKSFIDSIYNRINNDLLLWEPAAPQPAGPTTDDMASAYIPSRLDFASQFFSVKETFQEFGRRDFGKLESHVSFVTDDDETVYASRNTTPMHKSIDMSLNPSMLSLSLHIGQGSLSLCSNIGSGDGGDAQTAQIFLELENGSVFSVTRYHGNPNLDYACIQIDSCSISHKIGILSPPSLSEVTCISHAPPYMSLVVHPNEDGVSSVFGNRNVPAGPGASNHKMVTVVLKIELEDKRAMKQCVVAAVIHGLTMRHQFLPIGHSWLEQIIDVFDIQDTPVLGYKPPSFLTEVHFHMNDCVIDYKPLHLVPPLRAITTLHSFSLSSNVVADSPLSVLQIIMDNVSVYISNNSSTKQVDLHKNFVCVLDISLLELCLKLSNQVNASAKQKFPDLDLLVSNNQVQLRTCADSCTAFASLIRYIAEDGDIVLSDNYQGESSSSATGSKYNHDDELFKSEISDNSADLSSRDQSDTNPQKKMPDPSYQQELSNLMADAMKDVHIDEVDLPSTTSSMSTHSEGGRELVSPLLIDFSESPRTSQVIGFSMQQQEAQFPDDDDFCIIVDPKLDNFKDNEPQVEYLVADSVSEVNVIDNHFAPVLGKADQLRAPRHFPTPVVRYTIRELTCSWYMYGGNDFKAPDVNTKSVVISRNKSNDKVFYESQKSHRSPRADRKGGGVNRDLNVLMEFHLTKLRFQHETYSPEDEFAARTVFTITDFEIRDRLQSSQINKFLYHFHNEASPKQSHANMLLVKALLVRPAADKAAECRLRISLQPLRLNVDQDSLAFLTDFFTTLSSSVGDEMMVASGDQSSAYGTTFSTAAEPMSPQLGHQSESDGIELRSMHGSSTAPIQPLFFREVIFSPDVPIRLDYHGKHIDIEQGKIAGLLMGLGQLNCSQLKLRKIVHRHGLLGVDRVVNFALNEWAADIRNNQLPSILGGVGPLHSVVQFFQGVRDLVWLPVEQYRRDGRIVRGLQRGTTSFGTSTSMAVLEITNRFVWLIQTAAETAYDVVSPADFHKNRERQTHSWRALEKHARQKRQPNDLREGFNNAITVVRHGVVDTASSIAWVAQKEHERKGLTGAVGGVLRHIPLTLVRPVIIASEATSNVLSGMRNQILPDAKREDEDKWRTSLDNM